MKKYISVFALSIVLCSQSFAGFNEIETDIQNNPSRAASTCQTLSELSKKLGETHRDDDAYPSMGRCYGEIAGNLKKLASNDFSALTSLSQAVEELQSLEAYLGMVEKPIPSLSQPSVYQQQASQLATVPVPKAQAVAAAIVALPSMKLDQPLGPPQSKGAFLVGSESLGVAALPKHPAAVSSSRGFAGSVSSSFTQGSSEKSFGRQREVSDFMWENISTLSQTLEDVEKATEMNPSLLLNPRAVLTWIQERKEELKTLALKDSATTEIVKAHYKKLEEFMELINIYFNANYIEDLDNMHALIGRPLPRQKDIQLIIEKDYKELGWMVKGYSKFLSRELSKTFFNDFPEDAWVFSESMAPRLQRPEERQKAFAAISSGVAGKKAVAPVVATIEKAAPVPASQPIIKVKISDTLDANVKGAIETLNEKIQMQLKTARGNEAIMKLGSNEVARPLLQTIEANLGFLRGHLNLPETKTMTVDDLVAWHRDLVKKFSKIFPFELKTLNIKGIFKNLSDHFSDPYQYVDNRVPHQEYLKALTFSKTVYDAFGENSDMSGLVLGAFSALEEQGLNCGAGAFGRSILLYNNIFQFMRDLEK